jgi:hypothetical protein
MMGTHLEGGPRYSDGAKDSSRVGDESTDVHRVVIVDVAARVAVLSGIAIPWPS